jgi:hypothetical protein
MLIGYLDGNAGISLVANASNSSTYENLSDFLMYSVDKEA